LYYDKEINYNVHHLKKLPCVTLSSGANDESGFAWIVNNLSVFKKESAEAYNKIISAYLDREKADLYFVIEETKDFAFTAVERHLGSWKKYKEFKIENKSNDYYLSDNHRYAYALLNGFEAENMPMYHEGTFVFVSRELNPLHNIIDHNSYKDMFDCLYAMGRLTFLVSDYWTEGNSLTFYSKSNQDIATIVDIAKDVGFIIDQTFGEITMKKNFLYYMSIVEKCYTQQNKPFKNVSENELKNSLVLVDEFTEAVSDAFCEIGLLDNFEPNEYGLELEDVISYLLKLRYAIVD